MKKYNLIIFLLLNNAIHAGPCCSDEDKNKSHTISQTANVSTLLNDQHLLGCPGMNNTNKFNMNSQQIKSPSNETLDDLFNNFRTKPKSTQTKALSGKNNNNSNNNSSAPSNPLLTLPPRKTIMSPKNNNDRALTPSNHSKNDTPIQNNHEKKNLKANIF